MTLMITNFSFVSTFVKRFYYQELILITSTWIIRARNEVIRSGECKQTIS